MNFESKLSREKDVLLQAETIRPHRREFKDIPFEPVVIFTSSSLTIVEPFIENIYEFHNELFKSISHFPVAINKEGEYDEELHQTINPMHYIEFLRDPHGIYAENSGLQLSDLVSLDNSNRNDDVKKAVNEIKVWQAANLKAVADLTQKSRAGLSIVWTQSEGNTNHDEITNNQKTFVAEVVKNVVNLT